MEEQNPHVQEMRDTRGLRSHSPLQGHVPNNLKIPTKCHFLTFPPPSSTTPGTKPPNHWPQGQVRSDPLQVVTEDVSPPTPEITRSVIVTLVTMRYTVQSVLIMLHPYHRKALKCQNACFKRIFSKRKIMIKMSIRQQKITLLFLFRVK